MKSRLGDKVRLQHILDAIESIEKSLKNKNQTDFENDFILKAAIERWIEIVGEAAYNITKEFKNKNPFVEWKSIEGLSILLFMNILG